MRKFVFDDLKIVGIDLTSLGSKMRFNSNVKFTPLGYIIEQSWPSRLFSVVEMTRQSTMRVEWQLKSFYSKR